MIDFHIETFGCKVNSYDTGLLQKKLLQEGFVYEEKKPQVLILNTCAVTAESSKEALRWVRRKKKDHPSSKIVLTGCSAQVDTELLSSSGAHLIVANSHKSSLPQIIKDHVLNLDTTRIFKSNIFKKLDLEEGGGEEFSHTRSFLKIQDGCNSFCTFCVIPFARGKSRSLSLDFLVDKVFELYEKGVREVVLTGVHIGDYEGGLENLVRTLLVKTPMPRFRLSSLEPVELTDELLELYCSSQMCKHFHMSIQSVSDQVLKDMKRKYSSQDVLDSFSRIHKKFPEAFVGMDVICGFPTETENHFLETYERLSNSSWSSIHVFSYSPRPSTYALRMKPLDRNVILNRSRRLRALSFERFQKQGENQIGSTKKVLVLKNKSQGLSRDYWKVKISENLDSNVEYDLKIKGFDEKRGVLF